MRIGVFDIETDGLLDQCTKLHMIQLMVVDDGVESAVGIYRAYDPETFEHIDNVTPDIQDALDILADCDMVVGQNIIGFDLPALEKLTGFVLPEQVIVRDTLVLARMIFADEKERDFRRHEKGQLPGKLIGQHGLEAWGYRMGILKGDYKAERIKAGREAGLDMSDPDVQRLWVWGTPNPEMEAYAIQDVPVTYGLWKKCVAANWSEQSVRLEHRIHEAMFMQEQFGFQFDHEKAQALADRLTIEYDTLVQETIDHFPAWYSANKWYKVTPNTPPRAAFGEDESRQNWAEVTVPKKPIKYKDPLRGEISPDAPFCQIKIKEFSPTSRQKIVNRLTTIYEWKPQDFTETGAPSLDDDVLANLEKHIPICGPLREIFFLGKLKGALATGDNAWLKKYSLEDGRMHGYVNVGGTVSGRGSHLSPNMGQVVKVKSAPPLDKQGEPNKIHIDPDTGNLRPHCFDENGAIRVKPVPIMGRNGRFGWECRSLFTAPPGWFLMGADLAGLELRCFGARLFPWDQGAYLDLVLNGDPHTANQIAAGLKDRDQAKTFIYATLYGAGDEKIGSIVLPPSASAGEMKAKGRELKSNFEQGIPAYRNLLRMIATQCAKGNLLGLDGRKLYARSKHSALNLQLQSDGALLAKAWVLIFIDMMEEHQFRWGADFGVCAWVHDEIQVACRTMEIALKAAEIAKLAAAEAGIAFDYPAPIAADSKIGFTWAETH
jgi:hypothetical protein